MWCRPHWPTEPILDTVLAEPTGRPGSRCAKHEDVGRVDAAPAIGRSGMTLPPGSREMAPPPTDEELCRALGTEGTRALEMLYDRYAGLVFGLARSILSSSEEAEDLTQEIFIGLHRHCAFDPARGSLGGYLSVLTRSRALDRLRSRRSRLAMHDRLAFEDRRPPSSPAPLEQMTLDEGAQRVRASLGALPEKQRRVLELAYFGGLSQSQIAAELNAPLGTVKSWTRQALLGLRESLRDLVG